MGEMMGRGSGNGEARMLRETVRRRFSQDWLSAWNGQGWPVQEGSPVDRYTSKQCS